MNFETISFNHGTHNERKQLMRSIPQGFSSTAGISKKLVTIFARHLDSFVMTFNFSLICQIYSGSGQVLEPGQVYLSPGLAKIAPWCLARRDPSLRSGLLAKVPGPDSYREVAGWTAPPTLSAHTRNR